MHSGSRGKQVDDLLRASLLSICGSCDGKFSFLVYPIFMYQQMDVVYVVSCPACFPLLCLGHFM